MDKPCARCGKRPRSPTNSYCHECQAAYQRKWYAANPEKVRHIAASNYAKRRQNGKLAAWEQENREYLNDWHRTYSGTRREERRKLENKAYNLGRLFAQMEAEGVVRPEEYQTAGITPTPVIVPAFARLAERGRMDTITEVMNQLPMDAFTSTPFTANEQTAFALGYYHQKARMLDGQEETDTPLDTRMLIRVESDLKQWVMAQGGSDYVRRLLRRERAR